MAIVPLSTNCNSLLFSSNLPNIIPANISGYTVLSDPKLLVLSVDSHYTCAWKYMCIAHTSLRNKRKGIQTNNTHKATNIYTCTCTLAIVRDLRND